MSLDPYEMPEHIREQLGIRLPAPSSSRGLVYRAGKALAGTNTLVAAAQEHTTMAPQLYEQCATVALEAASMFKEAAEQARLEIVMAGVGQEPQKL